MNDEIKEGLKMKYFVLKPKGKDQYAVASRKALIAYADIISSENSLLAKELRDWVNKEIDNSKI